MTKEQFKIIVKGMKAIYTQPSFIPDQYAFDVWYNMLKDLDYKTTSRAVQIHMQTSEDIPKPASIRKHVVEFMKDDGLGEEAAWQLVWNAICNSGYHADEEFEKLPPLIKKVVGSPGWLRQRALSEVKDDTISVWQSNFRRAYMAEKKVEQEKNKLSPDVLRFIQAIKENQRISASKEEGKIEHKENKEELEEPKNTMPQSVKERLEKLFQEG